VRSREPGFLGPGPILDHAEKTNRLPELGRAIRDLCADAAANVPRGTSLFVNLHPADLGDPHLFSSSSALATYADRVVLEITERGALGEEAKRAGSDPFACGAPAIASRSTISAPDIRASRASQCSSRTS